MKNIHIRSGKSYLQHRKPFLVKGATTGPEVCGPNWLGKTRFMELLQASSAGTLIGGASGSESRTRLKNMIGETTQFRRHSKTLCCQEEKMFIAPKSMPSQKFSDGYFHANSIQGYFGARRVGSGNFRMVR